MKRAASPVYALCFIEASHKARPQHAADWRVIDVESSVDAARQRAVWHRHVWPRVRVIRDGQIIFRPRIVARPVRAGDIERAH